MTPPDFIATSSQRDGVAALAAARHRTIIIRNSPTTAPMPTRPSRGHLARHRRTFANVDPRWLMTCYALLLATRMLSSPLGPNTDRSVDLSGAGRDRAEEKQRRTKPTGLGCPIHDTQL